MTVFERALVLAAKAHIGQLRKAGTTPYIVHPVMVSYILQPYGFSESVLTAAVLHDVVEDTDVTIDHIQNIFGTEISSIVAVVTENKSLPWRERKEAYIRAVRAGSMGARAVSIADKIHNIESLLYAHAKVGDKLWEAFSYGKEETCWFQEAMLTMFQDVWDHPLVGRYEELVTHLRAL